MTSSKLQVMHMTQLRPNTCADMSSNLFMRKYSENLTNTHSIRSIINNIHHIERRRRNHHAETPDTVRGTNHPSRPVAPAGPTMTYRLLFWNNTITK